MTVMPPVEVLQPREEATNNKECLARGGGWGVPCDSTPYYLQVPTASAA